MNDISLRIKQLIDEFGKGNNSKFAEIVGTSEANIRNYISGRQPKYDFLNALISKLEISCEWLLTGKGEMLKETKEPVKDETAIAEVIELKSRIRELEAELNQIKGENRLMRTMLNLPEYNKQRGVS